MVVIFEHFCNVKMKSQLILKKLKQKEEQED